MKIAVIGTGVAGLGAAHVLSPGHAVTVYETDGRAGGHAATVDVPGAEGTIAIDTGFIVHNPFRYPRLVSLLAELGVATVESEMSFSVTCRGCGLAFSSRRPLASPRFLREVLRFQRTAEERVATDSHARSTIAGFARSERYSARFLSHFLVPLCSAVWSTAPGDALGFPAAYGIGFLSNHGVLGFRHPRWRTVAGGSRSYVRALLDRFAGVVRLGATVTHVRRDSDGVTVRTADDHEERFDRILIATHPDQALALLADPTEAEQRVLGAFRYAANETVLHTDERLLPAPGMRASWNYHLAGCEPSSGAPTMTYSMNRLHRLSEPLQYCVTLNRGAEIDPATILGRYTYAHPQYTFATLAAQAELPMLVGPNRTAYAGAYHGHGFHEDGLVAGLRAAEALAR